MALPLALALAFPDFPAVRGGVPLAACVSATLPTPFALVVVFAPAFALLADLADLAGVVGVVGVFTPFTPFTPCSSFATCLPSCLDPRLKALLYERALSAAISSQQKSPHPTKGTRASARGTTLFDRTHASLVLDARENTGRGPLIEARIHASLHDNGQEPATPTGKRLFGQRLRSDVRLTTPSGRTIPGLSVGKKSASLLAPSEPQYLSLFMMRETSLLMAERKADLTMP